MSDIAVTEGAPEGTPAAGETPPAEPTVESLAAELESLKAESRKWEGRAKANLEAKKELDALKVAQMTDDEKRAHAAEVAEAERVAVLARAEAAEAALARSEIVIEFSLDADDAKALEGITDPDTLRVLAARLSGRTPVTPGLRPNPAQGARHKPAPTTPGEAFADAVSVLF